MELASLSLAEIREFVERRKRLSRRLLEELQNDPRQGVRRLARRLDRRRAARQQERRRMQRLLSLERELWSQGVTRVAGVDEAGVGPLAGPVVAAAVVFPPGTVIPAVDDSKRLDPEERGRLCIRIRSAVVGIGFGVAEVAEIDRLNVYHAALQAMRRAVLDLPLRPQQVLVDARTIPDLPLPQHPVAGGDSRHFSIAAASIMAKTYRDELMCELDSRFPEYGFSAHKGYATPQHQQAIRRHGLCPAHRRSYAFVQELAGESSPQYRDLKRRLDSECSAEELAAVRHDFRGTAGLLPAERRRLQQLITRHKKKYPGPEQLSLLD